MEIEKYLTKLHNKWDININVSDDNNLEIIIRLTKSCNENCKFCSTYLDKTFIKYEDFINVIDYLYVKYKDYNISFCLSWWEPTLYKDITKVLDYIILKTNNSVEIQTNATLFSSVLFLNKFLKYRWRINFFVSFHSHIPKIYNFLTSSKLYEKSFKGIINLYKYFWADEISLNFVMNKMNCNSYFDYLNFIAKYFWNYWIVNLVFSVMLPNKEWHEKLLLNYSELVNILNTTHEKFGNINKLLNVSYQVWWYCQLPFCFFRNLNFIKDTDNFEIIWIDKEVGWNIMSKTTSCKNCIHNFRCIGFPKKYLEFYWEEWINPIL